MGSILTGGAEDDDIVWLYGDVEVINGIPHRLLASEICPDVYAGTY